MAEGLKNRQAKGYDPIPGEGAQRDTRGAHFTKDQRKQFRGLCDIAIHALAERRFDDWYDALRELAVLMVAGNFRREVYQHTCREIENVAIEITGNQDIFIEARAELARRRTRVITIGEAANDPVPETDNTNPPRESSERQPTD